MKCSSAQRCIIPLAKAAPEAHTSFGGSLTKAWWGDDGKRSLGMHLQAAFMGMAESEYEEIILEQVHKRPLMFYGFGPSSECSVRPMCDEPHGTSW